MAHPNLSVSVEPSTGGKVTYLPLAPKTAGAPVVGQLALALMIRNNEPGAVRVTELGVTFLGGPPVAPVTIALDLLIPHGASVGWNFEKTNDIVLPVPAPGGIELRLRCKSWTDAVVIPLTLAGAGPGVPGGFDFPAKATDLRIGEYWAGQSLTHGAGAAGSQLFAYDMDVVGLDPASNTLSLLLPGTDMSKNANLRIWGKPIYAVADGSVLEAENAVPNNPVPVDGMAGDSGANMLAQKAAVWNKPGLKNAGAGNHFYLQHTDHVVLYAHMQMGSLNPKLLAPGAAVKRGQFLGLSGNSGNASRPHLHVHAVKGTAPETGPLRPFPFRNAWVIDRAAVHPPDPSGPWTKSVDKGLPSVRALIWPALTAPTWYPPGWREITRTGIAEASFQTEFDRVTGSGYRLVWLDGFDVDGDTFFNAIFRPEDGTPWVAKIGLDAAGFQQEFDARKQAGFRVLHIETYLQGSSVRFAGIWVKATGPLWVAYHGRSAADHQNQFNGLTAQGYVPTTVSAVVDDGDLLFSALYEKRDVGGFVLSGALPFGQYQAEFDANMKAGRHLAGLNAVSNGDAPLMLGIWEDKAPKDFVTRHAMSAAEFQAEFNQHLADGYLTRAVSACDNGDDEPSYAALWSR